LPGRAHGCPVEEKSQPKHVYLSYLIVILGLDPRIQGLSEQLAVALDCRVKSGNDNKV